MSAAAFSWTGKMNYLCFFAEKETVDDRSCKILKGYYIWIYRAKSLEQPFNSSFIVRNFSKHESQEVDLVDLCDLVFQPQT